MPIFCPPSVFCQQERQWLHFIFNDNVPAAVHVSLCVCANCYEGWYEGLVQSWLCLDADPHKRISLNHTGPSNCTWATGECCQQFDSIYSCLASSALVRYAMAFEASLMLIILQGSLVVTVKSLETCADWRQRRREQCAWVWRLCWRQTQLLLAVSH